MRAIAAFAFATIALLSACGSGSSGTSTSTTAPEPTVSTTSSTVAADPIEPSVLIAFPTPAAAERWVNIDDSVMGGVSASESSWIDTGGGALLFTGELSTERNGGFASTLGPQDISMGIRAVGARALGVHAIGDGRTYLLQLRAGRNGTDRWVARFTPLTYSDRSGGPSAIIPLSEFEPVNQFLRPTTPSTPLDPTTILQIGIYVLDGQVGNFRLVLERITALR